MTRHDIDTIALQALHLGFAAQSRANATGGLAPATERGRVPARQPHQVTLTVRHTRLAAVADTARWPHAPRADDPPLRARLLASVP